MAARLVAYASKNDAEGLEMVLRKSTDDIDAKDENGSTALCIACHKGNIDAVKVLLKYEASTVKSNKRAMSPLALACIKVGGPHEPSVRCFLTSLMPPLRLI